MDLFASDDRVALLDARLAAYGPQAPVALQLELAWYLRQRDVSRALKLTSAVEAGLPPGDAGRRSAMAQIALIRAEAAWLRGALDEATDLLSHALGVFDTLGEPVGMGDAQWLAASVWHDLGEYSRRDMAMRSAIDHYRAAGDTMREEAAVARDQWYVAFEDPVRIRAELAAQFGRGGHANPLVACWIASTRALLTEFAGDYGESAGYFIRAFEAAVQSGQHRVAVAMATNAGDKFAMLDDLDSALEWDERGLALARAAGWPLAIGQSLMQAGNALQLLGRYDDAQHVLSEAIEIMGDYPGSRSYAVALGYLGELALALGDPAAALKWFQQDADCVGAHGQTDMMIGAWHGQARALSSLGRPAEALVKAEAALGLARHHANLEGQIRALRALANLHKHHALPLPENAEAPTAALHYLGRAMALTGTVTGYAVPDDLLDEVAREYALVGDFQAAYETTLAAVDARNRRHNKSAHQRAVVLQIRQEIDQAKAEAVHQRQVAASEAARAAMLEEANATLRILGEVGLQITACRDAAAVCATLDHHVHDLLDASSFSIYLLDDGGATLTTTISVEGGQPLPPIQVALDSPTSNSARSVRERREVLLELQPTDFDPNHDPGTLPILTALFGPLAVGERVLGVMTIQSPKPRAYGERERAIFKTLCAYGAIALANAAELHAVRQASVG
ncbi:MAG: GAF domain-containing protein [Burkholderiales bacterium]|nr:GAF domain-containing protein [Burkholderiales bacterium]